MKLYIYIAHLFWSILRVQTIKAIDLAPQLGVSKVSSRKQNSLSFAPGNGRDMNIMSRWRFEWENMGFNPSINVYGMIYDIYIYI